MEDWEEGGRMMVGEAGRMETTQQSSVDARAHATPSTESEDLSSSSVETAPPASALSAPPAPVKDGRSRAVAEEAALAPHLPQTEVARTAQTPEDGDPATASLNGPRPDGGDGAASNGKLDQLPEASREASMDDSHATASGGESPPSPARDDHGGIALRPRPKRAAAPTPIKKETPAMKRETDPMERILADFVPDDPEARKKLHSELMQRFETLQAERRRLIDTHSRQIMAAVLARHQAGAVYMPSDRDTERSKPKTGAYDTAGQANEATVSQPHSADAVSEGPRGSTGGGTFGSPTMSSSGRVRTPSQRVHQQPGERLDGATILRRYPQMRFCLRVLKEMMRMKEARPFLLPVDKLWNPESIPDYFEIVKQPMDLGTIRQRLETGEYGTDPEAFRRDVRLVWSNAMTYNPPETEYYVMAKTLNEVFEQKMQFLPPPGEVSTAHGGSNSAAASAAARKRQRGLAAAFRQGSIRKTHRGGADSALGVGAERKRRGASGNAARRPYAGDGSGYSPYGTGSGELPHPEDDLFKRSRRRMDPADRVRELEQRLAALQKEKRDAETLLAATSTSGRGVAASPPVSASGLPSREAISSLAKVPVTQQEMAQLAEDIGRLDGQQLRRLVELFGSRPGLLTRASSGEYEMNIQQASNETLRELQAFCSESLRPAGRDLDPLRTMSPTAAGARVASINRMLLKLNHELERARKAAANAQRQRMARASEPFGAQGLPYFASGGSVQGVYNGASAPTSGSATNMAYSAERALAGASAIGREPAPFGDHKSSAISPATNLEMNGSDESSTEHSLSSEEEEY
ncbi:hypothetical protein CCYA_CCYA10G2844 [Cyanidiococcus yangmingshanensis]|nr:hypothetical protein CCYA_CCYA10G2844 [Cyanidiococcus yangmingshanensis]